MEFFEKIGKKASEAYKITADKTGKIAKETKIKMKMNELKGEIDDIYREIGKKVYEKHIREEELCIKKDLEEECTKIDVLSGQIDSLLKECLDLKDKKQCQKCSAQIDKDVKFCPECGAKQEEIPAKEVEILEDLENSEVKPEKEQEKEEIAENLKDKIEEKEDNQDSNNNTNSSENLEENTEQTNLETTIAVESFTDVEEQKKAQE